jgi:TP901 family phage tail tape measure protein
MAAMATGFVALRKQFDFSNAAGRFQQQLVATSKIMVDGTENLQKLRDTALDVGLRTPFSPDEIIRGLRNLGELGFRSAEAIAAIKPAADLAVIGEIKLSAASKAIAGTLRSFHLEASQAGSVTDMLATIIKRTGFQATDFASGLADGAAEMGGFGQSVEDTLTLLGALRNLNLRSSKASTAMREAARRVFSQQSVVNKLTAAGIPIIDKETGARRRLVEVLFDMSEHMKTLGTTQADLFATSTLGARGRKMMDAIMAKGRKSIDEDVNALKNSAKTAEAMLNTFEGQKQLLRGATETFKVVVGDSFADVLKPVIRFMAESLTDLTRIIRDAPAPLKKAAAGLALVSAGMLALTGTAVVFTGVIGMAAVALTTFGGVAAISLGVFGALVTSVGLVVAGLVGLGVAANNGVGGARSLVQWWEDVKLVFDGVKQALSGDGIRGGTLFELVKKENEHLLVWVVNISRWINRAKHFIDGMWIGFQAGIEMARPSLDEFKAAFEELGKTLGINTEKNELMGTSVKDATSQGAKFGQTLSKVAVIGIKFMTSMIRFSNLLIDNFGTLKNTLITIAQLVGGAAFLRLAGMLKMGGVAGAARSAGGGGGAGTLPMMLGGGARASAASASSGAGASLLGFMGNSTPMTGETRHPANSIPLPGMPSEPERTRRQRMRDLMKKGGGLRGMARAGAGRAFGTIPGLMGTGMMVQGVGQAQEGNYGSALMMGGMGAATMVGKQGFESAIGFVAKHPAILGTIAAGVATGMAAKHVIEKKSEAERATIDKVLAGGAQAQYTAEFDRHRGYGMGRHGQREVVKTIGSMTPEERAAAEKAGNIRSLNYYKNRRSHWEQMDQYRSQGIDAEKMATRDSQGNVMKRGEHSPSGGQGEYVRWTTQAQLDAMRQAHREGLLSTNVTVNNQVSHFVKGAQEAKNAMSDGAFQSESFIGSE